MVMIAYEDGEILKDSLPGVVLTIDYTRTVTGWDPATLDRLPKFAARGPAARSSSIILKPDITAPGDDIISVKFGSGSDSDWESGSSMAAAHVSGAIALLR